MTELTDDGMAVKNLTKKTKIAGNSFEAPYIHKRGNYYYLFASIGSCCEGMNSTYKVVVGRSENVDGPYLNKSGVDMNNGVTNFAETKS
jgi:arabinan endo-1,5-alpha-L-arabinosidase